MVKKRQACLFKSHMPKSPPERKAVVGALIRSATMSNLYFCHLCRLQREPNRPGNALLSTLIYCKLYQLEYIHFWHCYLTISEVDRISRAPNYFGHALTFQDVPKRVKSTLRHCGPCLLRLWSSKPCTWPILIGCFPDSTCQANVH